MIPCLCLHPKSGFTLWNQLQDIPKLSFPRWINLELGQVFEIHGFCDVLQLAMCATVYIRSSNQDGQIVTQLICSKTKVAPLKKMTIHILNSQELCY